MIETGNWFRCNGQNREGCNKSIKPLFLFKYVFGIIFWKIKKRTNELLYCIHHRSNLHIVIYVTFITHKWCKLQVHMKNHITMTLRSKGTLYLEETMILRTLLISKGHKRNGRIDLELHRAERRRREKE